jgi:hypothetical protein
MGRAVEDWDRDGFPMLLNEKPIEPSLFPTGNLIEVSTREFTASCWRIELPWVITFKLTNAEDGVKHYSSIGRSGGERRIGRGATFPAWLGASSNSSVWMIDSASLAMGIRRSWLCL